jgi:hypothetical protein
MLTTLSHPRALLSALLLALAVPAAAQDRVSGPPPGGVISERRPRVQVALLLDNSGSMQGLLNQARTQLWKVVNTFAPAKQNGRPVPLERGPPYADCRRAAVLQFFVMNCATIRLWRRSSIARRTPKEIWLWQPVWHGAVGRAL